MTVKKFNVLIVGAGKIGAFFDKPRSESILTHAHAFTKHPGFRLIGFVDINSKSGKKAAALWNCNYFPTIQDAMEKDDIDVVCVSVSDEDHYQVLKELSKYSLSFIFTEKPITQNISDAKKLLSIYKKKKTPLMVNYSRRFVPEFNKLRRDIYSGKYGKYVTGSGLYGKGVIHNGSHIIDFIRFLVGEVKVSKVINKQNDYYKGDPSAAAILSLKNKRDFYLQYVSCKIFTVFEIDLLFSQKRIRIIDSGLKIEEYEVKKNELFKGYKNIIKVKETNTSINKALFYAVKDIYYYLTRENSIKCDLNDGYKALEICENIIKETY